MVKKINIKFGNKTYYLLLGLFAVLIVSGVAYAYQSGEAPSVFGHSWYEQESFFDIAADTSGCTTANDETLCQEFGCLWVNNDCVPSSTASVSKIKPKTGVTLTSDGTKAYATENYVDSAVGGGGSLCGEGYTLMKENFPVGTQLQTSLGGIVSDFQYDSDLTVPDCETYMGVSDTCDGNSIGAYVCAGGITKTCRDLVSEEVGSDQYRCYDYNVECSLEQGYRLTCVLD
jgi:hypothetical protein